MLTIEEIKKRIIPILEEKGVRGAVLFGSYAKGTANEDSDVDLLVDCDQRGLEFMTLKALLRIELDLDKIDVFNTRSIIEGGRIDKEIKKHGIIIYGKVGDYAWKVN